MKTRGIELADIDRAWLLRRPVSLLVRPISGWSRRWARVGPFGSEGHFVVDGEAEQLRLLRAPYLVGEQIVGRESTRLDEEGRSIYRTDLQSCGHPWCERRRFDYCGLGGAPRRAVLCAGCWSRQVGWPADLKDHRHVLRVSDVPVLPGWSSPARMRIGQARWRFGVVSVEARRVQSITNDEALAAGADCEGDDFASHRGDFRWAWFDRWPQARWDQDPWCWFVRVQVLAAPSSAQSPVRQEAGEAAEVFGRLLRVRRAARPPRPLRTAPLDVREIHLGLLTASGADRSDA